MPLTRCCYPLHVFVERRHWWMPWRLCLCSDFPLPRAPYVAYDMRRLISLIIILFCSPFHYFCRFALFYAIFRSCLFHYFIHDADFSPSFSHAVAIPDMPPSIIFLPPAHAHPRFSLTFARHMLHAFAMMSLIFHCCADAIWFDYSYAMIDIFDSLIFRCWHLCPLTLALLDYRYADFAFVHAVSYHFYLLSSFFLPYCWRTRCRRRCRYTRYAIDALCYTCWYYGRRWFTLLTRHAGVAMPMPRLLPVWFCFTLCCLLIALRARSYIAIMPFRCAIDFRCC